MKKILFLCMAIFFITSPSHALDVEVLNTFRYDWRNTGSDTASGNDIAGGNEYLFTLTVKGAKPIEQIKRDLKLSVWSEAQVGIRRERLDVARFGGEIGIDLFKWLYWGEQVYYGWFDRYDDKFVLRSKLTFNFPFKVFSLDPSLRIFEEHRYDLSDGRGFRNDVGVGINLPISKIFGCYLGWRHADRIHRFDTDYVEGKVSLNF